MRSTLSSVAALLLGIGIILLGNGLLGTLLSVRTAIEGFATETTGLIMSAYFVGLVAGSLYAPRVIERVGHIRAFTAFASIISATALMHAFVVTPLIWTMLRMLSGFCVAGIYMVTESWLNARASNENRGRILSLYMITCYFALGTGQFLLTLDDPARFQLFAVVSILFSLALVPVALTKATAPSLQQPSALRLRQLYRISPLGMVGCFATGMSSGAVYGMGPIFATGIGLSLSGISTVMGAIVLGGLVFAWPVGRLSDRFDRRTVITVMSGANILVSLAIIAAVGWWVPAVIALACLFGGLSSPLYSVAVAHANDHVAPKDLVKASSGLLVAYGLGAGIGPLAASAVMGKLGPAGLFVYMAVISGLLGTFALYRMRRRAAVPQEEQTPHVPLPRTTPAAIQLDPRGEAVDMQVAGDDGAAEASSEPAAPAGTLSPLAGGS